MMLISFIIPYHNEPVSMLRQCIESILALSLKKEEREIILVDDGSKESPRKYIGDYESDLTYIYQENQGLSGARNTGIEHAKGDYIQFIDSDDYLFSEVYENIIFAIREKQMDMLMFRFSMTENNNSKKSSNSKYRIQNTELSQCWQGDKFLCKNNLRAASCIYVFKRSLLGDLRFKKGILHEDSLFTPQLIIKAKTLYVTTLQAYFYRQHKGTIMSKRDSAHIKKRLDDTFKIQLELKEKADSVQGYAKVALYRCIYQQIMGYIYFIIILTKSLKEYKWRTSELREHNLYPLPLHRYTLKYWLFAFIFRF